MTTNTDPNAAVAAIFFRHWQIGWAVFDAELGEGIEAFEATEAAAEKHRDETWEPEQREDVEIFPVAFRRGAAEREPVVRLTREEFDALAAYRSDAAGGE